MLRAHVRAGVALIVALILVPAAPGQKEGKTPEKKERLPRYTILKFEGGKLTVVGSRKGPGGKKVQGDERTLTVADDTRYVLHSKGKRTTLPAEEGKKRLTKGARIRVEADAAGKVKVVYLGVRKKAKDLRKSS